MIEYVSYPSSKTHAFRIPAGQYKLILIDEYYSYDVQTLDMSNVKDSHIAIVTSYTPTAAIIAGFTEFIVLRLSGSLRSTKEITECVRKMQDKQQKDSVVHHVPVIPIHNIAYRTVNTTHFPTADQCIKLCISCVKKIHDNDKNESIMIISTVHRWFLYRISQQLHGDGIQHIFRRHSLTPASYNATAHNTDNSCIILCDVAEARGTECSTVIYVQDEGTLSTREAALYAPDGISRATTQAVVYVIDGTYTEDIPVCTSTAGLTKIPCYMGVGEKNSKTFIQYMSGLVTTMGWDNISSEEISENILVVYRRHVRSLIEDIKISLPHNLQDVLVFQDRDKTSFYSLDISKQYALLVNCGLPTRGAHAAMYTTLPVRQVTLITEEELPLAEEGRDATRGVDGAVQVGSTDKQLAEGHAGFHVDVLWKLGIVIGVLSAVYWYRYRR